MVKRTALLLLSFGLALAAILVFMTISLASAQPGNNPPAGTPPPLVLARLHPSLLRSLQEGTPTQKLPIIVEWQRDTGFLDIPLAPSAQDRSAKRSQIVSLLQSETQRQAAALLAQIQQAVYNGKASQVRTFWVSPVIALNAAPELIHALASRSDVVQIRSDELIHLKEPALVLDQTSQGAASLPWNLEMIDLALAQQALGLDGSGVVVANLDTGVDWQHPALMKKYRGYNPKGPAVHSGNWYVATNEDYQYPGDGHGHGTHTMGTMVGDDGEGNRIGVAPGARWIAVKVFTNQGFTYESWVHDAFQWVMAPDGNPALAPDVVNNSWGSDVGSDTRYRADVSAMRLAGILPVFSAGNNGPDGSTIGSPASYPEALAVGALDPYQVVADFSSRGPSIWGETKPEVAAPGVDVRSSFPGGGYALGDGTSMAAPHVTGLAALLLQADPSLTPDQLEAAIKSTAHPLGSVNPNNDTGWGLVDAYAAGVQVTSSGELLGIVKSAYGIPIAYPTISATPHGDGYTNTVTITGDSYGEFILALQPNRYDVTASAFGYDPQTLFSLEFITGTQTHVTFTLSLSPVGSLFGRVSDLASNAPLSATLSVNGTPASTQTDPNTGDYTMTLPVGTWQIGIMANAHRLGHITPTITAGSSTQINIALPAAPRILLVDSGRWYYGSYISYFEDALSSLDYPYTLWPVTDPQNPPGVSGGLPLTRTLAGYDLVVWSAPQDSPGLIGAGETLSYYLRSGGHLLISGQDVAYFDAGNPYYYNPQPYLINLTSVKFTSEGNLDDLSGTTGNILEGLAVSLNTPDSAGQQIHPDAVSIKDNLLAQEVLAWPDNTTGAVIAESCRPYRSAWLGFGLEGAGPRLERIELTERLLGWFDTPYDPYKLAALGPSLPIIGLPGNQVTGTLQIYNLGVLSDTLHLQVNGAWPVDIALPDGRHFSDTIQLTLDRCASTVITATAVIPSNTGRNTPSIFTLDLQSLNDPLVTASLSWTVKTPAPALIVDDERWYHHQDQYTRTLDTIGLPYDLYDTQGGDLTPQLDILSRYSLTLWTTGYDWYSPLTHSDETRLADYMDRGGRLLLTSQDLLDVRGLSDFVANRLGVAGATLSVTPTQATAVSNNSPGIEPQVWRLLYPFKNWGDGMYPTQQAQTLLADGRLATIALTRPSAAWRSAFFSFPLETLEDKALREVLGKSLLWLSAFGESTLEAPPAAQAGSTIPVSLTLGLATPYSQDGLRAVLPLLPETSLITESLRGPWIYEPLSNTLVWQGDLTAGVTVTMGADLELQEEIPQGTTLYFQAQLYDPQGLAAIAETPLEIGLPWLRLHKRAEPLESIPAGIVFVTNTIQNEGVLATMSYLTETIPPGLNLLSGTLTATLGSPNLTPAGFTWHASIPAGSQVVITYQALVSLPTPGARLLVRSDLGYSAGSRIAWVEVFVPDRDYFPTLFR